MELNGSDSSILWFLAQYPHAVSEDLLNALTPMASHVAQYILDPSMEVSEEAKYAAVYFIEQAQIKKYGE